MVKKKAKRKASVSLKCPHCGKPVKLSVLKGERVIGTGVKRFS